MWVCWLHEEAHITRASNKSFSLLKVMGLFPYNTGRSNDDCVNTLVQASRFRRAEWLRSNTYFASRPGIKIYRTAILPVVLYGCETWSLTFRQKRRLRVFENRVLRRIFGPRRDEVTGEWRKLRLEELNDLCSSPNIIRVIKSRS